jgi:putative transposase
VFFFPVNLALQRLGRLFVGRSVVAASEVENAVLRHQSPVLRRSAKRPLLSRAGWVVLAAASRLVPRERWGVSGVAADASALAS